VTYRNVVHDLSLLRVSVEVFLRSTGKAKGQTAKVNSGNATFATGLSESAFANSQLAEPGRIPATAHSLLIRRSRGFIARCALLQNVHQVAASFGYAGLFTSHDVLCLDWMAINVCACVIVRTKRGTLE
jgi:hypothetical protein